MSCCLGILAWCCGMRHRRQEAADEDLEAMIPAHAEHDEDEQPISLRTANTDTPTPDFDVLDAIKTSLQGIPTGNVDQFAQKATAAAGEQLASAFSSLLHEDLRIAVVTEVFNWMRTNKRQKKRQELRGLFRACAESHLSRDEILELQTILVDLPPAVLGDKTAQQESRIFVDARGDVKEAFSERFLHLSAQAEAIGGQVTFFLQHRTDALYLMPYMLGTIPKAEIFRVVMIQLILASRSLFPSFEADKRQTSIARVLGVETTPSPAGSRELAPGAASTPAVPVVSDLLI